MARPVQSLVVLLLLAALATASRTRAEELGTVGPTHPIAEPHLLNALEQQLRAKEKSGELARLEAAARQRIIDSIEHPRPLAGIRRAERARTFYFDPSIVARDNITDAKGNIIVPAGTRANPLAIVSLSKRLLFFDGGDEQQVAQARELIAHYQGQVKPILVAGSYLALMQRWRTPVYYDQQGALTRRLGITQVPALVSQEGAQLRIDELAP